MRSMLTNHLHWDKVIHIVHSLNTQKVEAESGVQGHHVIQFEANPSMSTNTNTNLTMEYLFSVVFAQEWPRLLVFSLPLFGLY